MRKMKKNRWMAKIREGGQLLVEFAIVLPVFAMLTLGTIQILRLGVRQIQLNYGAYMGARVASVTGDPQAVASALREISSHLDPDNENVDHEVRSYVDPNGATRIVVIVRATETGLFPLPQRETNLEGRMDLMMGSVSIASMKPYYTSNAWYPAGPQIYFGQKYIGVGAQINATSGYDQILKRFAQHEARFYPNENHWPTGIDLWYPIPKGFLKIDPVLRKYTGKTDYMIKGAVAVQNYLTSGIPIAGWILSWISDWLWGSYSLSEMNTGEHWSREYTALMHGQWTAWYEKELCGDLGWGGGCGCGDSEPGCFEMSVNPGIPFYAPGSARDRNAGYLKPDFGITVRVPPAGLGIWLDFYLGAVGMRRYGKETDSNLGSEWAFINGTWANASWPEYLVTFITAVAGGLSYIPYVGPIFRAIANALCAGGGVYDVWAPACWVIGSCTGGGYFGYDQEC